MLLPRGRKWFKHLNLIKLLPVGSTFIYIKLLIPFNTLFLYFFVDLPNHIKLVRGNGNNNHSSSSISSRSGTSLTPLLVGSNSAVQRVFSSFGASPVSPSSLSLFFRPHFPTSKLPTTSTSSATYGKANEPEEVYSTKLISAMALSENMSLRPEDFLLVSDSWKQDWQRGVQVPASDSLLNPVYRYLTWTFSLIIA